MNQKHLLGIGNIREECADTLCAKPTYVTKHATNAQQTYRIGSAKQMLLLIYSFNAVYVFIRYPYSTKLCTNTYSLIISDDIHRKDEEARETNSN